VLLASVAGALFVRTVQRPLPKAGNSGSAFIAGLAIGLVAIALHSLVDYSLHKPANAFLLATLCGMSVAAAYSRSERKKPSLRRRRSRDIKKTPQQQAELVAGVS
jgi:hypothetical protein